MSVRSEIHQTVAVLRFGESPVNSLRSTTRRDLVEAIDAAVADSRIEGISDGAGACVIMSATEAQRRGLSPLGRFAGFAVAGCEPKEMGIGLMH